MENKFTPEMFEKCRKAVAAAKSAEEILAFAKENDIEMTAEKADELFVSHHKSGELSDDELDNVSGGGCGGGMAPEYAIFQPGERVRFTGGAYAGKCGTVESYNLYACDTYNRSEAHLSVRLDDGATIEVIESGTFDRMGHYTPQAFRVEKI